MSRQRLKNNPHLVPKRFRWGTAALLVGVLVLTAVIRIPLLDVPLERDEGEYAYAGQLILQGLSPYVHVYNMKMPGIYAAYALIIALFGHSAMGIHTGLLLVNAATIVLIFFVGKKVLNRLAGLGAAGCFAMLSLSPDVQGVFAHAENFAVCFVTASILVLLSAMERRRRILILVAGILLGLAFLMKQHAVAFMLLAGIYLVLRAVKAQPFSFKEFLFQIGLLTLGCLVPFGLTCLIFWAIGAFDKFWFWTFTYAREYVTALDLATGWFLLKKFLIPLVWANLGLWLWGLFGLVSLGWHKTFRTNAVFLLCYLLCSLVAVSFGLYFRPHYFIFLLPVVSLFAGAGVSDLDTLLGMKKYPTGRAGLLALLFVAAIFHSLYTQRHYVFERDPNRLSRMVYGSNPFPESRTIAQYIRRNTFPNDRIAVIGSEPQIYFYARRRAATGHIYMYPLMERHSYARKMQEKMIEEIEAVKPAVMVFVNIIASWQERSGGDDHLLSWFDKYSKRNYKLVGLVDIILPVQTVYRWGSQTSDYKLRSGLWIAVLQRKDRAVNGWKTP